jgi:hypothetical protein
MALIQGRDRKKLVALIQVSEILSFTQINVQVSQFKRRATELGPGYFLRNLERLRNRSIICIKAASVHNIL